MNAFLYIRSYLNILYYVIWGKSSPFPHFSEHFFDKSHKKRPENSGLRGIFFKTLPQTIRCGDDGGDGDDGAVAYDAPAFLDC